MNFDFSVLGGRLKSLRKQSKKTQKELAEELGLSPASIISYEKAQKMPAIDTVIKIASYFHVSLDWLCGLNDELPPGNHSENGLACINLSDFLKTLVSISYACSNVGVSETFHGLKIACFEFKQEEIINFVSDWQKILELYKGGTITKEMCNDWVNGVLSKYSKFTISKSTGIIPEHFESDETLTDDDLPPF